MPFSSSIVSIQRSSPDGNSCEESITNQMTNGSSPVTVMDTLSCRYAGRSATYCMQFSKDGCESGVAMETVQCKATCLLVNYYVCIIY